MQCNIDAKGRSVRLVGGFITLAIAIVFVVLALTGVLPGWAGWGPAIGCGLAGAFQVYEGWAGWCVVRAMGFKTPI